MRGTDGVVVKKGDFVVVREEIMDTRCIGQVTSIEREPEGGGVLIACIKLGVGSTSCKNTALRKAGIEELI